MMMHNSRGLTQDRTQWGSITVVGKNKDCLERLDLIEPDSHKPKSKEDPKKGECK